MCLWGMKSTVHKHFFQFMLWVFDEEGPLKIRLLSPYMVENMDYDRHRYGNNKKHLSFKKACENYLCDIYEDNNNCPIIMNFYISQYIIGT